MINIFFGIIAFLGYCAINKLMGQNKNIVSQTSGPRIFNFLFSDTRVSLFWFIVRVYVGWEWLSAGIEKVSGASSAKWVGDQAGVAVKGFLMGALAKTSGAHPDVQAWYAAFINNFAINHVVGFSYTVAWGEVLVGVALILGALTGVAAFFGAFMNLNYLLSGTVSVNPQLFVLQIFLISAWRVSGWIGFDRFILPIIGSLFGKKKR